MNNPDADCSDYIADDSSMRANVGLKSKPQINNNLNNSSKPD